MSTVVHFVENVGNNVLYSLLHRKTFCFGKKFSPLTCLVMFTCSFFRFTLWRSFDLMRVGVGKCYFHACTFLPLVRRCRVEKQSFIIHMTLCSLIHLAKSSLNCDISYNWLPFTEYMCNITHHRKRVNCGTVETDLKSASKPSPRNATMMAIAVRTVYIFYDQHGIINNLQLRWALLALFNDHTQCMAGTGNLSQYGPACHAFIQQNNDS